MSYRGCENCGCRVYNGICVNCNEELWIEQTQGEFIESTSEEWEEKVLSDKREQKTRLKKETQNAKPQD